MAMLAVWERDRQAMQQLEQLELELALIRTQVRRCEASTARFAIWLPR